ncbi:MAG: hypothetical protein ABR559_09760 [Gemmatimonadota bacterium]
MRDNARRRAVLWAVLRSVMLLGTLAAFPGCFTDEGGPAGPLARRGALEPTRTVAIGDGFAAGARDDALYATAQEHSVPALFAAHVGVVTFAQPLIGDPGFALEDAGGRLQLVAYRPLALSRLPRGGPPLDPARTRPYDNLGVPGALLSEALIAESAATSLGGNPFYDVVLRSRGTAAEQAAELDASLILLWIGTTDIAAYVAVGGDEALAPGLPTAAASFAGIYETLLEQLLDVTEQVVLFTVPDVTRLPFATGVPPFVTDPETGEPILVTVIEQVIDPVTGDTTSVQRQVPAPLLGPTGPLAAGELVTLEALPLLATGVGVPAELGGTGTPLPDRVVLNNAEIQISRAAVAGYNAAILALAAEHDLAVVDIHGLVIELDTTGIVSDGVLLTADYLTGQAFSLDGLHFTAKGNGLVVNRLLEALARRYGSTYPPLRTASLPGIPLLGFGGP